jgi:alkylhydroperoxidase family enzyme
LDQEIIDRVAEAPESADWAPHERALLAAAGELVERHHIEADTWLVLAEHYQTAQLVEIPFIVGQYTMLSMVANSLGIPVAADDPPLPPSVVTTSDP